MRKKIINLAVLMLIIMTASTGCSSSSSTASSWPGYSISDGVGYFSYGTQVYALDLKNGSLLWAYPAEANASRQFYAAPAAGDDMVVVGDYDNNLAALDMQSGFEKWQFSGADDRYIGSALVVNGFTYAPNSDHYLYALDENGDLMWRYKAEGPNWTKPLVDGETLYMASMDHNLYAFNLEYAASDLDAAEDGSRMLVSEPVWSLDLGAAVVADPVILDGVMYVGTIDGALHAVDLVAQKALWSFNADGEMASIWGSPVAMSEAVLVGDQEGNVYAVSAADGSALWPSAFSAGISIVSSGAVLDDSAVFGTTVGKIFSINLDKEPQTLAELESALYASIQVDDEKIILAPGTKDGLFTALNTSGVEIWNYVPAD